MSSVSISRKSIPGSILVAPSYDDENSVDSNFDPEVPPSPKSSNLAGGGVASSNESTSIKATLESQEYDAATIRAEFRSYQAMLPKPDKVRVGYVEFMCVLSILFMSIFWGRVGARR